MAVKDSENSKIPWLVMNPKQGADMYGDQVAMQPTQQDITNMSAQSMQAPVYAAPRNDQLAAFQTDYDSPQAKALMQELDANRKAAFDQGQQGVGQWEQLLQQHLDRTQNDPKLDLSPLMSFADNLYGTRLTNNYKAPTTSRGAFETTAALQQGLQKAKESLIDNEQNNLNSRFNLLQKNTDTKLNAIKALTGLEEAKAKANEGKTFKDEKETIRAGVEYKKQFGDSVSALGDFAGAVRTAKGVINRSGGSVPGPTSPLRAEYEKAVSDMIIRYNSDVAKLGALAGGDLALLSKAVGNNPDLIKGWIEQQAKGGGKTILGILDSLEKNSDATVEDYGKRIKVWRGKVDDLYADDKSIYYDKKNRYSSGGPAAGGVTDASGKLLTREEKIKLLQSRGAQ